MAESVNHHLRFEKMNEWAEERLKCMLKITIEAATTNLLNDEKNNEINFNIKIDWIIFQAPQKER